MVIFRKKKKKGFLFRFLISWCSSSLFQGHDAILRTTKNRLNKDCKS